MGIGESIALVGLVVTVVATAVSGIKALWSISKGLGNFEGKILEMLAHHQNTLQNHEDRLRAGKL